MEQRRPFQLPSVADKRLRSSTHSLLLQHRQEPTRSNLASAKKKSYSSVTMRTSLLQYYFQPQPKTLLFQRNYKLEIRIKESTSFVVFSEHAGLHMNQPSTKSPSSVYNSSERTYYSLGCDEKITFFCITQPVD